MALLTQQKSNLGFFPTPLVELSRLTAILGGPRIFMKRDDMTGLALGGNKTRKLEYLMADAVQQGADTIITAGAEQSNHCRQTAAAAACLQMDCHLVLGGEPPESINGNLLLDNLFGCHIHWAGNNRKGEDIPMIVDKLRKAGKKPYVVPYGGSNHLGSLGFISALEELHFQANSINTNMTHIIFASSSGGTHAGLMLGNHMLDENYELIGINIDKDESSTPFINTILDIANQTAQQLDLQHTFNLDDITLESSYTGDGYGVVGDLEKEAISLLAQHEGILLDPVYTGRAMGGLINMIRAGRFSHSDNILFWHTGGAPALFAYSEEFNPSPVSPTV